MLLMSDTTTYVLAAVHHSILCQPLAKWPTAPMIKLNFPYLCATTYIHALPIVLLHHLRRSHSIILNYT